MPQFLNFVVYHFILKKRGNDLKNRVSNQLTLNDN